MKHLSLLTTLCVLFAGTWSKAQNTASDQQQAQQWLNGERSLKFEQNVGQIKQLESQLPATDVTFVVKSGDHNIFLLKNGLAHQFEQIIYPEGYDPVERDPEKMMEQQALREQIRLKTHRMDMVLVGANPHARISKEGRSAYPERYYKEQAYTAWNYEQVTYHDIYPNIDWVIYSRNNELKYDFIVHPGGDPGMIKIQFRDGESAQLKGDGSFQWSNPMGWVQEKAPESFQGEHKIESSYEYNNGLLSFQLGDYDASQSLRIDPTLLWGTYYGGSSGDVGYGIATDGSGNVLVTGSTGSSAGIATPGAHDTSYGGGSSADAFVVKFNSSGVRQWGTYYGGNSYDVGYGIATDGSGNVLVTGYTGSSAGIATAGAHDTSFNGGFDDAFVVKFDSSGVRQWGTYYGGSDFDNGLGIATDGSGNVLLTGYTESSGGIATTGAHQTSFGGSVDAFVAKFNSSGVRQWGTYYGGSDSEYGHGIATDGSGNVLVTGYTRSSSGIASSGAHQTSSGGGWDAFVVKFNSNGVRQWSTYYGGGRLDQGYGIATDGSGNVLVTGSTGSSAGIATPGAHDTSYGGGSSADAFVVKFNSSGVRQWGTYFGGSSNDVGYGIATDGSGNVLVTGYTGSSAGIATTGAHDTSFNGGFDDAFVVKFNSNGVRQWGTYYGGGSFDYGLGIATDGSGNVLLTGYTEGGIATAGAHQTSYGGGSGDAFVAKFSGVLLIPQISNEPKNATICASEDTSFSLSISGSWDSLQWQRNTGSSWQRVAGGMDTTYSISNADTSLNGDQYRAIAFGPAGNDTSVTVTLSVYKLTAVTVQPSDSTVCSGTGASFAVEAEGESLSYQWQVNTGSGWTNVSGSPYSGATTGMLSLSSTDTTFDGYEYRCLVNGSCDSDTSDAATLRVYRLPLITKQPVQPASKCGNDTIELSVESYGTGLSYQWQENDGSGWVNVGSNAPTYNTGFVYTQDNGTLIRCIVSGTCTPADTSDEVEIRVRGDEPKVTVNGMNGITQPTPGQSDGSIDILVNDFNDFIRFSRWSFKEGVNYPSGNDFDLNNAPAGEYYLMLVTREYCIYYEGPYVLGAGK